MQNISHMLCDVVNFFVSKLVKSIEIWKYVGTALDCRLKLFTESTESEMILKIAHSVHNFHKFRVTLLLNQQKRIRFRGAFLESVIHVSCEIVNLTIESRIFG